ncbi:hypothetical protein WA158_000187 [Blastocystis sp. Blastoise]
MESSDIVRIILQYFKENNLSESYKVLSEETGVTTNTVANKDTLLNAILNGKWDLVLEEVSFLTLPTSILIELVEQIVFELLEMREVDTARMLLTTSPLINSMREEQPERFLRLTSWLKRNYFDPSEAYPAGENKEKRRQSLAMKIGQELTISPPSRLLVLLQQALKYQQEHKALPKTAIFDVYQNIIPAEKEQEEAPPTKQCGSLSFSSKSYPLCATISTDSQYLITGSLDGFIEIWDMNTCKYKLGLTYQEEKHFLSHNSSILSLAIDAANKYIASGDVDGNIKVFDILTGKLMRKLMNAHEKAVSSLCFAPNGLQLLSTSFDGTIRLYGLKAGKMLKLFRGHSSYVNNCIYINDKHIASSSSDGTVKIWDVHSCLCITTITPKNEKNIEYEILQVLSFPNHRDMIIVLAKADKIFIYNTNGSLFKTLSTGNGKTNFIQAYTSTHGKYLYCLGEDGLLYTFSLETYDLYNVFTLLDHEPVGMCIYRERNIIGVYSDKGILKLYKS